MNAARRRFTAQTLGGVGYITAAVAVISAAAVFSVYTYTTVAALEADADNVVDRAEPAVRAAVEAAKRTTAAAREKSANLILPVSAFSLASLAVAGACFGTRRLLVLSDREGSA